MAAATTVVLATLAAAGAIQQSEQAKSQAREAKREQKRQGAAFEKQVQEQQIKEVQGEQTKIQRMARSRQKVAASGGSQGRQSTILGGAAAPVSNVGNQASSGAAKTLLGV